MEQVSGGESGYLPPQLGHVTLAVVGTAQDVYPLPLVSLSLFILGSKCNKKEIKKFQARLMTDLN